MTRVIRYPVKRDPAAPSSRFSMIVLRRPTFNCIPCLPRLTCPSVYLICVDTCIKYITEHLITVTFTAWSNSYANIWVGQWVMQYLLIGKGGSKLPTLAYHLPNSKVITNCEEVKTLMRSWYIYSIMASVWLIRSKCIGIVNDICGTYENNVYTCNKWNPLWENQPI